MLNIRKWMVKVTQALAEIKHTTCTPGQIIMFAGALTQSVSNGIATTEGAPPGWLSCNGNAVSRTYYAELFAIIGTTYGSGDGSTTFNLPNFRGRVPVGVGIAVDNNSTANATATGAVQGATTHVRGDMSGEETHTLTKAQIPEFEGSVYIRGYKTSSTASRAAIAHGGTGIVSVGAVGTNTANGIMAESGISDLGSNPLTISFGGGSAHNNMPPYSVINYLIATGKTN